MTLQQKRLLDIGDHVLWLNPEDEYNSNHHTIVSILTNSNRVENIDTVLVIKNDRGEYSEVIAAEIA
jgi:hypothetical protein